VAARCPAASLAAPAIWRISTVMGRRSWVRVATGVLVIGGVIGGLWLHYRPQVRPVGGAPEPPVPRLQDARAQLEVSGPGHRGSQRRAGIACDGDRRSASGFWAGKPGLACDALASTRAALLSSPGCTTTESDRLRLVVRGRFGDRRFRHRSQRGGCESPDEWLAVNALVIPVEIPERELEPANP
jgi:hypothetical protein